MADYYNFTRFMTYSYHYMAKVKVKKGCGKLRTVKIKVASRYI